MRIRRHESLPSPTFNRSHGKSSCTSHGLRRHRTQAHSTASIMIGRRLGATKNNPYVGSFRHAPPTSLRSMEASSLPSLSSRRETSNLLISPFSFAARHKEGSSTSLPVLSLSVPTMKTSPYVGWFRHAPPSFSSYKYVHSPQKNKNSDSRRVDNNTSRNSIVQHKVNSNSLQELDRWHQQLTSLLMGIESQSEKAPPKLLSRIINGRLLGGNGGHGTGHNSSSRNYLRNFYQSQENSKRMIMSMADMMHPRYNTVLSRLTSWLLFPLMYADDACYDDYGCLSSDGNYGEKRKTNGLKLLISSSNDDRSIEIDTDEDLDSDEDDDDSFASSCEYNERHSGVSPETEREFTEMNVSVSEIAEAYYAHQLLESNSDTSNQQSPLSPHHASDDDSSVTRQRLDYEITQMDIARMTRNASRHLDVDSILTLPTTTYRRKHLATLSPSRVRNQNMAQSAGEQSYHHVCTPIHEESSGNAVFNSKDESQVLEDGWSFLMVSGVKSTEISPKMNRSKTLYPINDDDESSETTTNSDDVCVICLEPFKEGDRLRALPCDHSFHVGCIDRWLSGSHSYNECFTAGCPTCKKRPTLSSAPMVEKEDKHHAEETMSGSVPSWAFANLGSAMAMSSGGFHDS